MKRSWALDRLLPMRRWWPLVDRVSLRHDLIAALTGAVIVAAQAAFATFGRLPHGILRGSSARAARPAVPTATEGRP